MSPEREIFVAREHPDNACPDVLRVRSTLLSASLHGLRQMGWADRYFAQLPPELHDGIKLMIAGVWIPIDLALAHYRACDRMALSADEIKEIGSVIAMRTQKTFVGTLGSVAAGAGATPWSIYQHSHRIWSRIFDGGDLVVFKTGPKDLEIICTGCALFEVKYFRTALGAYYAAIVGLLSKTVHWRELPAPKGPTTITLRLSWV